MKLLILLVLFGGAMAQTPAYGVWQKFKGNSYVFYPEPLNWANAQRTCLSMGGHLAVINSLEEEEFVQSVTGTTNAWIGLSDAQQNGFWFWINSDRLGYTNWCPGEPNNKGGNQKCALLKGFTPKCWDDQECYRRHPYVCERTTPIQRNGNTPPVMIYRE